MIKIAPSILSADFSKLGSEVQEVELGGADLVHIDVMDGKFVPNITIGPVVVESLKKITNLPFDVHLMIEKPENYIDDFVKAGADIITIHQESTIHLHRAIQQIRNHGVKVGVALNPSTPLESIRYILDEIDMVLIMTVNPGFGGQKLISSMERKIRDLREISNERNLNLDIQVDGGIKIDNVSEVIKWGANIVVAGSAIFKGNNIADNVRQFRMKTSLHQKESLI